MDTTLQHLAQAAAFLLFLEFFILLLIFLAISGGLAFGLRWIRRKTGGVFETINGNIPRIRGYVHTGTDMAAKPFILGTGALETVKVTAEAVRERVRKTRETGAVASAEQDEESTEPLNTVV